MDLWLHIGAVILALIILLGAFLLYKAKGLLNWRTSLNREIRALEKESLKHTKQRQDATSIIVQKHKALIKKTLGGQYSTQPLLEYLESIAVCFHPNQKMPHYQIPIGHLLEAVEQTLMRFQLILMRPGFGMISKLRIRHIVKANQVIDDYRSHRRYGWIRKGVPIVKWFNWARIWLMGDWIGGTLTLLRNYFITRLSCYLFADLYLFVGKLALNAYDNVNLEEMRDREIPPGFGDILEAIEADAPDEVDFDVKLKEIRNQLVGFKALAYRTPGLLDVRHSLKESAYHIAKKNFPLSPEPLQEATIGALFDRLTHWMGQLQASRNNRVMKFALSWKLQTFIRLHEAQKAPLMQTFKNIGRLAGRQEVSWARWILKLYKWGRHPSPIRIGVSASWFLSRKLILAFLYGRLFDMSCKELLILYAQSNVVEKPTGKIKAGPKRGRHENHRTKLELDQKT